MRFLVIGADGFVGRNLVQDLAKGHQVTAVSRRPQANANSAVSGIQNVKVIETDLTRPFPFADKVDVIVHAAARTPAPDLKAHDYVAGNISTTLNVIDLALRANAKLLVYLSAISVYGRVESAVVDEDTPIREPSLYGMTKYIGEQLLADVADSLPSIIFRLPVVIGRDMNTGWFFRTHQTISQGQPLNIYNGDSPYNMVGISDVPDLVLRGAQSSYTGSQVFTVSCKNPMTIRQVAETMKRRLQSKSNIRETATEDQGYIVSTEKVRRDLGFLPKTGKEIVLTGFLDQFINTDPAQVIGGPTSASK